MGTSTQSIRLRSLLSGIKEGGDLFLKTIVFDIRNSPHCLNTTAVDNYSVRTTGKRSCGDTVSKGSSPLAPLDDFGKYPDGPNPRIAGETAPGTFYNSLFALILATLRFKSMSRGQF